MDQLGLESRTYEVLTRRSVLRGAGGLLLAGGALTGGDRWYRSRHAVTPLLSDTVALAGPASRRLVSAADAKPVLVGTRVLRDADARPALVSRERAWLGQCAEWTRSSPHAELVRSALLDLRVLSVDLPAVVAGWSPPWRYVWPRDAAHVAAALAVSGHPEDAATSLLFLQRVQRDDGWFEARYLPDGSGPPDDRPPQLDGLGWALWGCDQVCAALPPAQAGVLARRLRHLITRCLDVSLHQIDNPSGLPQVSPDYWEVHETELTLGTAAPLAAGLASAAQLCERLGDRERRRRAQRGHQRLMDAIHGQFGPSNYARYADGHEHDAAVGFLLPPYAPSTNSTIISAFQQARQDMARPAGGLAPGAGWKQDGISWTPETSLFALVAASIGHTGTAEDLLSWLDAHRTPTGSLPEKVLYDGHAAAVAPLAWTAALVVLTAHELHHDKGTTRWH